MNTTMQKRLIKKRGTNYVVNRACERCKAHHKKCNGVCPCERCLEANETCIFPNVAEEDIYERINKIAESYEIRKIANEHYETVLKADQQRKLAELDQIQAKVAFVRNKIAKYFSTPNLSTYVYWYSQIISALTGAIVPYPDLDTLLQDDDLLKNALMMSVIGCGALISNDPQTAQKYMTEASEFVTQYQLGDEMLFNEEISLLFNIAFYRLSVGDWQQSSEMWKRLNGLRATRVDPGKVSALRMNKAKEDQEDNDNSSYEDHLLHVLTFSLLPVAADGRSMPQEPSSQQSEPALATNSTTSLVQTILYKVRAVATVGNRCMKDGTKLNQNEVNRYIADLTQQASSITDDTLREIVGLAIHVGGVFAWNASDQRDNAIRSCEYIITAAGTLIAQMPHFIFPYIYVFSILPFLKLTKQEVTIQNIGDMFSNTQHFLARVFWHQYNQLLNCQPLLPFLANFFKRPQPPDLTLDSPSNEHVDRSPSIVEVSHAINCTTTSHQTPSDLVFSSDQICNVIGQTQRFFTENFESRISS